MRRYWNVKVGPEATFKPLRDLQEQASRFGGLVSAFASRMGWDVPEIICSRCAVRCGACVSGRTAGVPAQPL